MLEITGKHIAALTDSDLRDLIGRLCEAEVNGRGFSTSHVAYGGHQDASDGGLDVRVELPAGRQIEGYIARPLTGFQVKATPMPPSKIKAEIRPNGRVRLVIQGLANSSGGYLIACSAESTTGRTLENRKQAMHDALQDLSNIGNLFLDFYDQTRIASWVRSHPGIIPWVREKIGQPIRGWRSYGNWSNSPTGISTAYLLDDQARIRSRTTSSDKEFSVSEGIAQVRQRLSEPGGIVRLVGLSGVGKTRLVQALFEQAVRTEPLNQSLAIYSNSPENPDPQPLELLRHLLANRSEAILIIDNCSPEMHKQLADTLSTNPSSIRLLTIEYDVRDESTEDTDVFELRPSSDSLITTLIMGRFPQLSPINADVIAHVSGGNARIALALAKCVGRRKSIAHLQEEELFQRLFKQRNDPDNRLFESAQACSLLYSFDGEDTSATSELALLGSLCGQTVNEVHKHVKELLRRNLIQRRSRWRALLPHALANRLAAKAIDDIPRGTLNNFFLQEAQARMLKSFSRRLSYMHTSQTAVLITEEWLAQGELLGDITMLSELGREMFRNLAPVAPEAALFAIERATSTSGAVDRLLYPQLYGSILRSIAYDANLFERCVLCLARFAQLKDREAEWNQEGKMLASLFKLQLSGTVATIEQRLSVIEKLFSSEDANSDLALEALKAALESTHFSSYYGFDFGSRERDYGFLPSTQEEVKHWYASTLALCESLLISASQIAPQIKTAVADQLRGLWAAGCLYEDVEKFCRVRAFEEFWPEGWRAVRNALYYDGLGMPIEARQRLEILEHTLAPKELAQEVRGLVFNRNYDLFSPGEYYEERGDIAAQIGRVDNHAQSLGLAVASDDRNFQELLPEIILASGRIWPFACGLAEGTKNPVELWQSLVNQFCKTQESLRQTTSLHGFLSCLSRINPRVVSSLLDEAVSHPVMGKYFPGLQTSVQDDTNRFQRLVGSLALGLAEANAYRHLEFGGAGNKFTATEFKELLLQIADKPHGFEVAIEILHMRLTHGEDRGKDSEEDVLDAGRLLLARIQIDRPGNRIDFELGQVISSCLFEESGAAIASQLSRRILDSISSFQTSPHDHDHVMSALFRTQPIAVLDELAATVGKDSTHGMWVLHRVEGLAINAINSLTQEDLFSWCEQEPALRYQIAATAILFITNVPQGQEPEWSTVAIRLLKHAPDRAAVLRQFMQRSQPSGFVGSIISALESSKKLLDQLASQFDDELLLQSIEQEKAAMQQRIATYRLMESQEAETSFE
jgi:hypothetical protein